MLQDSSIVVAIEELPDEGLDVPLRFEEQLPTEVLTLC